MCRSGARAAIAASLLDGEGRRADRAGWRAGRPATIDPATAPPRRTPGHGDDAGCGPSRTTLAPSTQRTLSAYRLRAFFLPTATDGTHKVYLAGHSLGAQPAAAQAEVEIELGRGRAAVSTAGSPTLRDRGLMPMGPSASRRRARGGAAG